MRGRHAQRGTRGALHPAALKDDLWRLRDRAAKARAGGAAMSAQETAQRDWVVERLRFMATELESGESEVRALEELQDVEDIPNTDPIQRRFTGARTLSVTVQKAACPVPEGPAQLTEYEVRDGEIVLARWLEGEGCGPGISRLPAWPWFQIGRLPIAITSERLTFHSDDEVIGWWDAEGPHEGAPDA